MVDSPSRGRLKVFFGYAAGVGKTFQMLTEAQRLRRDGVDLVVAYLESHGRAATMAASEGLEFVARATVMYRGARFEEMDTAAVLRRHPAVAVVDELPHTNVPGSSRAKRWEDVHELLDAGIDVLTTMNVQHLESLSDQIWQSTGVRVRETIPDWVLTRADEVVMVDLSPRALLNRLDRGVVYPPDRIRAARENFFKEPTLAALRELAIRQAAYVVASQSGAGQSLAVSGHLEFDKGSEPCERILLVVGPEPSSAALIRRGRRVADWFRAECLAVCVAGRADASLLTADERDAVERHLNFARALQIETRVLEGDDVAGVVLSFARTNGVTQIVIDRTPRFLARRWLASSVAERVVNGARGLQVTVVADRSRRDTLMVS
jgi:two-component system, OmpR family, sensor histidine kinase KdpD